jgi:MFS family permease
MRSSNELVAQPQLAHILARRHRFPVGDRVGELALPLIAVTLLGVGATGLGVLTALVWGPNLLAMVIGAWVDRRPVKRRLMIAADLLRAVVLLGIPVAYAFGVLSFGQLVISALLLGTGQVVFNMAYQTFYASIVPPESYVDANSKLSVTRGVSFVAGPALGGALVQLLTAPVAVLADALSFVFSAVMIGRVRAQEPPPAPPGPSTLRLAAQGMKLVFSRPMLRASLFATTTVNFFTLIANALLILFASRSLGLSAGAIGLGFGIGAVGAVVGRRGDAGAVAADGGRRDGHHRHGRVPLAVRRVGVGRRQHGRQDRLARRGRVRLGHRGDDARYQSQLAADPGHAGGGAGSPGRCVQRGQLRRPPARGTGRRCARHRAGHPAGPGRRRAGWRAGRDLVAGLTGAQHPHSR